MGGAADEEFERDSPGARRRDEALVGFFGPEQFEMLGQHDAPGHDGRDDEDQHDGFAHAVGNPEGVQDDVGERKPRGKQLETHKKTSMMLVGKAFILRQGGGGVNRGHGVNRGRQFGFELRGQSE
jgi:hypothetical protein